MWVQNSILPSGKYVLPNSLINFWNLTKWNILFIMISLKCGQPCVNFPTLFSTVKLKLGHHFSQFIYRFKTGTFESWTKAVAPSFWQFTKRFQIGIFEFCSSWTCHFRIHGRDWKLGFGNNRLDCTSKFLPVLWTVGKLELLKIPCFNILSDW